MPNRIIKESICSSEDIAKLSIGAERLFIRLIVKADDFGAYYGNEAIIRGNCFPLISDDIKIKQIHEWLDELVNAGLIWRYVASNGRTYIQFCKWGAHQQRRAKEPKYPLFDETCNQLLATDIECPRIRIRNSDTYSFSETNEDDCKTKKSHFVKPTIDEIKEYIKEQGYTKVNPEVFFDYYETVGWKSGKSPVKDWKACVRNWQRRNKDNSSHDIRNPQNYEYTEEQSL